MPRKTDPLPEAVVDLRRRFEGWRATRGKMTKIPRELVAEAVHLARIHGVNAVSRALRLNHTSLRDWAGRGKSAKKAKAPSPRPSFVQVAPLATFTPQCFQVEVESPGGAKMTIGAPGAGTEDVVALVDTFFRGGR